MCNNTDCDAIEKYAFAKAALEQERAKVARQELVIIRLLSQLKAATDRITELTK